MKISFPERAISAGPLLVLRHLYYYTAQYGLSVKQFTGQHQDYWAALPVRLQRARTERDRTHLIAELTRLADGAEARLLGRRAQLKQGKWAEKEVVISAQLSAVLAALPDPLLARLFTRLTGAADIPPGLRLVDLKMAGDQGEHVDFVEPDALFLGHRYLLMVELKTRGGPSSARSYPPNQLLNYIRLAAECEEANDARLPDRFAHLILVPSHDPRWLEHQPKWVRRVSIAPGRSLEIDPHALAELGGTWGKRHHPRVRDVLQRLPVYYRSWDQLATAYEQAVKDFDDRRNAEHWTRVGSEVRDLADRATRHAEG